MSKHIRLGIDGEALRRPMSGVGHYVYNLCAELDRLLPEAEFFVYTRLAAEQHRLPSERWHIRQEPVGWARKIPSFAWLKSFAPRLIKADRLTHFWGGRSLLPPLQAGIRSLVTQHKPNLHVLLAPLDPSDVEFITPDLAQRILRGLKDSYDYVVVDAPPAFTEVILRAFDMADQYLLLTTLDTPSLKNLKVTLGTLQALGMPRSKWKVIINRSTAKVGVTVEDVRNTIGLDIYATIPTSDAVPIATNQGKTVVESQPKHPVTVAINEIARDIIGGVAEPAKKSKFGFGRG